MFLCAAALLVYLLPKEGKFKYEFSKNKPWVHEDLLAPFDFAINKSDEEINAEKLVIEQNKVFYFSLNRKVQDAQIEKLVNSISDSIFNHQTLTELGKQYLDSIYNKGIVELIDEIEGKSAEEEILLMKENNVAEEIPIGDLFTIKSAYELIVSNINGIELENSNVLLDALESCLVQNVIYNQSLSDKDVEEKISNISPVKGGVYEKEKIISKGEIVSDEKFAILQSLKSEFESKAGGEQQSLWLLIGQSILVLILLYSAFVFLKNVSKEVFSNNLDIIFVTLLMVAFFATTVLVLKFEGASVYVIPYCIIPLLIRTFFGNRLALFIFVISIFLISFIVPNPFEFIILQSLTGILTLFTVLNVNKRAELFYTSVITFVVISFSYLGFSLIQEADINKVELQEFSWFAIAAVLTLLTYPLIYIVEKAFGYISDVTLLELADTNNKLLRELNLKAPGTFQHSLQVSNLAEEAIQKVGGNPLLVRTGALYHDIGKMYASAYFIENQSTGVNPHDELGYEESADIIISHVIKGIELAKKHNLPEQIIDFIRTHHGTTKTQYFLRMFKKENVLEEIDENVFEYPGPIPFSKETAVLMMADSVEAASRSLKAYDNESITNLVEGIIDSQVSQNQFVNTNITFNDISEIKKMFIKKLMNIYHVRIEYPK